MQTMQVLVVTLPLRVERAHQQEESSEGALDYMTLDWVKTVKSQLTLLHRSLPESHLATLLVKQGKARRKSEKEKKKTKGQQQHPFHNECNPMPSSSPEGPPHLQTFRFSYLGETKPPVHQSPHTGIYYA